MTSRREAIAPPRADWRSTLARTGLAAKGVLYVALGVLAVNFSLGGGSGQQVSERGAIQLVAQQPFGRWLLLVLTVGLVALMLWELLRAATGDPVEGDDASDRAKFAIKGVLYAATAATSVRILVSHWGGGSSGGGSGGGGQEQATAALLGLPGGSWIVGAVGVAVIAFGLYELFQDAWKARFMERVDRAEMDGSVQDGTRRAGRTGYAARGIVATIIGFFLVLAALQHDSDESRGLSGSLGALAEQPWGPPVLWVVAVGLVLYGLFCFAEARFRRAT